MPFSGRIFFKRMKKERKRENIEYRISNKECRRMVRRRRELKYGAKRRLPSIFGVPCSLFDIPFWFRLVRAMIRLKVHRKSILLPKQTHPGCFAAPSQEGNLAGLIFSCLLEADSDGGIEAPLSIGGPPPGALKVRRRRGVSPGNLHYDWIKCLT